MMAIIAEAEFRELYEKQPLFTDQLQLLTKNSFTFFGFETWEYWFPGPLIGKGLFSVVEALYLRDFHYFINKYENDLNKLFTLLSKLSFISKSFNYLSYTYEIIDYISTKWPKEWQNFVKDNNEGYVKELSEYYRQTIIKLNADPRLYGGADIRQEEDLL